MGDILTFSFIHTSDIHLGRSFSNITEFPNNDTIQNLYKNAVQKSFNKLIEFAQAKNVDFILIAGDTFDSDEQDFESKLILKEGLKKLDNANIKVYLICGNHDPLSSYNKTTFDFDENSNIKIVGLNTNINEKFVVENKQQESVAIVHALSFKESTFKENPTKYFEVPKQEEKNLFNIGLLHCDLNASKESPYAPCNESDLNNLCYDYWALGHIHVPTEKYSGTIQGRNTKETGRHGIKYIKVDNCVISKESFIPMDVIRFEDINIDLSATYDTTSAMFLIQENLPSITDSDCELFFVRINLTGHINYYNELSKEFFETVCEKIKNDSFGKICISQIKNKTTAKIDNKVLEEDEGISGAIYNVVQNNQNIEDVYNEVEKQLKTLLSNCNFSEEEYENFKEEIKIATKQTCNDLCSKVFNSITKED